MTPSVPKQNQINTNKYLKHHISKEPIEDVGEFYYLGSMMSKYGGIDMNINSRICNKLQVFINFFLSINF